MNRTPTLTQMPRQRPASRACRMGVRLRCRSRQNLKRSSHRNQQYSIAAITDGSGAVVERYAYTAYGTPTITDASGTTRTTTAIGNRYTYTGREWDDTLALYHYRARMYDSVGGRFCSRDPIGFEGSEWNLYEIGGGSPLGGTDPNGEYWWFVIPFLPFLGGCNNNRPPTDDECCDALKTSGVADKPGHVMCCQGKKISCVYGDGGKKGKPKQDPDAIRIINGCIKEHEDRHHEDTQPCKPGKNYEAIPSVDKNVGECNAYKVEQRCLENKLWQCKNPWCEQEVQSAIDFARSQKELFCGRAGIGF